MGATFFSFLNDGLGHSALLTSTLV
ncbi:MAG: hypothetical protein RL217_971, partial [Pseudomonadota bacterium]